MDLFISFVVCNKIALDVSARTCAIITSFSLSFGGKGGFDRSLGTAFVTSTINFRKRPSDQE